MVSLLDELTIQRGTLVVTPIEQHLLVNNTWIYVNLFHNNLHKNVWCNSAYISALNVIIKIRCVCTLLILYCGPKLEQSKTWNWLTALCRCLYNGIYNCVSMLEDAAVNKSKCGTFSFSAAHKRVISCHDCNQIMPIILIICN